MALTPEARGTSPLRVAVAFTWERRYGTDNAHMSVTMKRKSVFRSGDKEELP
jgi:hypothetical protein